MIVAADHNEVEGRRVLEVPRAGAAFSVARHAALHRGRATSTTIGPNGTLTRAFLPTPRLSMKGFTLGRARVDPYRNHTGSAVAPPHWRKACQSRTSGVDIVFSEHEEADDTALANAIECVCGNRRRRRSVRWSCAAQRPRLVVLAWARERWNGPWRRTVRLGRVRERQVESPPPWARAFLAGRWGNRIFVTTAVPIETQRAPNPGTAERRRPGRVGHGGEGIPAEVRFRTVACGSRAVIRVPKLPIGSCSSASTRRPAR